MARPKHWLGVVAVVASIAIGCSEAAPLCGPSVVRLAITNGTPTASYLGLLEVQQNAIVALTIPGSTPTPQLCSGVLVAPRTVLSAAHCFNRQDHHNVTVHIGSEMGAPIWSSRASAVVHPEYDLALLTLQERPPPHVDVVPLAATIDGLTDGLDRSLVQIAGFGNDAARQSGVRLFLVAQVVAVTDADVTTTADTLGGACFGDSGGPLLVRAPDGTVAVVGLLSRGAVSCFGRDVYTRLDVARDWLRDLGVGAETDDAARGSTLGATGRCYGSTAVWEQDTRTMAMKCDGLACGWSRADNGFRCIAADSDACEGVTDTGHCQGPYAILCQQGQLQYINCTECEARCERSPRTGSPICVVDQ